MSSCNSLFSSIILIFKFEFWILSPIKGWRFPIQNQREKGTETDRKTKENRLSSRNQSSISEIHHEKQILKVILFCSLFSFLSRVEARVRIRNHLTSKLLVCCSTQGLFLVQYKNLFWAVRCKISA